MDLKQVEALIPSHKYLAELWGQEEFQPVLEFFKNTHQQQVNAVQDFDLSATSEDCKVKLSIIRERLRMCSLFYNLPANIKEAAAQLERNKEKLLKFRDSQEGVTN